MRSANSKPRTAPAQEEPLSQILPGEKPSPNLRILKSARVIAIAATLAFALASFADQIALKGYSPDAAKREVAIEKQYRALASPR